MPSPFTESDLQQLELKGSSLYQAEQQLDIFRRGGRHVQLVRPCTLGDGILAVDTSGLIPSDSPLRLLADYYTEFILSAEAAAKDNRIEKFVPASGVATRMFGELQWACRSDSSLSHESPGARAAREVLARRKEFAFSEEWEIAVQRSTGSSLDALEKEDKPSAIFRALLKEDGLNHENLPKALLKFHRGEYPQTPLQEHLKETVAITGSGGKLHFTISEEHRRLFEQHIAETNRNSDLRISLSVQNSSTDTIVVTPHYEPFRTERGRLVFRPGGHGALLPNLQRLQSEIIFIKNVDNVVPESLARQTWVWSKLLLGILNKVTLRIKDRLVSLESPDNSSALEDSYLDAIEQEACALFGYEKAAEEKAIRAKKLFDNLNRPVRVCGMVPNQGEPGGGPFWIRSQNGITSKQIVESTQVDSSQDEQAARWRASTHFNPVLIACGLNDYQGEPFVLNGFVDPDASIVTRRNSGGRDILTMELPGLWNGSMAGWLSIFVEVPIINFNPVKTVLDLLRPSHLA